MGSKPQVWTDFAWQGVHLRVPEAWNLGRVDGNRESGYARLDDAEIVRAEVEWRALRRQVAEPVAALVGRYLDTLAKKARKTGVPFTFRRDAGFLRDRGWLAGREHELFTWEADYRAHNLALKTPAGRILLLRLLCRPGEELGRPGEAVFASLEDHYGEEEWPWSLYGLSFVMPAAFRLESQELRSGHIQLTFQQGKETIRVQRLSLAQTLLRGTELAEWYPLFFRKQLRDLQVETGRAQVKGHPGLHVTGRPRSRWRQLLRPLPLISPRPRVWAETRVWHCQHSNKVCLVDHLSPRREASAGLAARIADGYLCHQEAAPADPPGDARLAARPQ
ncbi:MAG: hypothetical protein AB1505_30930 [Candidatus Latescibacterota bacterium]